MSTTAWADHAHRVSRIPLVVVELDLDWVADPQVAPVNPDGSLCYRTPTTTRQGTFSAATRTCRWMSTSQRPLATLDAIPCVASVAIAAEEIRIGRGLGFFGKATVKLTDFTDDDRRVEDPFAEDASRAGLNPSAGSYLGKLLARNPYWTNRPIRVLEGWTTDGTWDPAEAITHHYFVRDVQGPTDGSLTITCAGPLQLLNLTEIEAPAPSDGTLLGNLDELATTATLADPVIAKDYPPSGFLRLGEEVVAYIRTGASLTLTREQHGTTASAHQAGDTLQWVLAYQNAPIVTIIADLLTTYGKVAPENLALDQWTKEANDWLGDYLLSGLVTQPTKVLDLVQELLEIAVCVFWWDDQTGTIRLKAVRPASVAVDTWNDQAHLLDRPQVKRDMTERISRTDILCDLRSASQDPKKASSYRIRLIGEEQGASPQEHGSSKVKLLSSRWLGARNFALGNRATYQITAQLRDGRQTIVVQVSAKDAHRQIGDVIDLLSRDLTDCRGLPSPTRCFVTRRDIVKPGSTYRYTLERFGLGGRFAFFTDTPMPDYQDASTDQRDPGCFLAAADGTGPNGDPPYLFA